MQLSDEEVKKVLNSESSNLCTIVIRNVKNIMGNKANDFGSFNIVMEPISFSIKFVVFNAFGILIEYSNESLRWYLNGKDGKKAIDSAQYDINEIDLLYKSLENTVKTELPKKYFRAYGWQQGGVRNGRNERARNA